VPCAAGFADLSSAIYCKIIKIARISLTELAKYGMLSIRNDHSRENAFRILRGTQGLGRRKPMAHFCANCGSPLNEGARFCTECGAAVRELCVPAEQSQSAPVPPPAAPMPQFPPPVPVPCNCARCGTALDADAAFCEICGLPVQPQTAPVPPYPSASAQQPAVKSGSNLVLIIICIILLILSIFSGIFLVKSIKAFRGSKTSANVSAAVHLTVCTDAVC